jgi:transcriptional regulator with XRE-family HTH domain
MGRREPSDRHDDSAIALGSMLRARREAEGLTITQLAADLDISRSYLSRLERGEYAHPSVSIIGHIAERFDMCLEDLYALAGYMRPRELPALGPYLLAKHPEWPEVARIALVEFYESLKHKYSRK